MQEGTEEATKIAFEYFTLAVELDPTLEEAHLGLGAVYAERYWSGWEGGLKNVDWAKASYERALELNPAFMEARRGMVEWNFYRGRSEGSLIQGREAEQYGRAGDLQTLLTRALAYYLGGLTARCHSFAASSK
jgi:tetratricopeptide (TPR) repeat protein